MRRVVATLVKIRSPKGIRFTIDGANVRLENFVRHTKLDNPIYWVGDFWINHAFHGMVNSHLVQASVVDLDRIVMDSGRLGVVVKQNRSATIDFKVEIPTSRDRFHKKLDAAINAHQAVAIRMNTANITVCDSKNEAYLICMNRLPLSRRVMPRIDKQRQGFANPSLLQPHCIRSRVSLLPKT